MDNCMYILIHDFKIQEKLSSITQVNKKKFLARTRNETHVFLSFLGC